jgi:signal transduction histidine kinase
MFLMRKIKLTTVLTILTSALFGVGAFWFGIANGQTVARLTFSQTNLRTLPPLRLAWPEVNFDRRNDLAYIDSLLSVGHRQLAVTKTLPKTAINDTLRLEALRFLAVVFKQTRGTGRDSSYYYAHQLVNLANGYRNSLYAVRGLMLEEFYFRVAKTDYPRALQLNQQASELCRQLSRETSPGWQVQLNMGDIHLLLKDYPNALHSYQDALALLPHNKILSKRNQRLLIAQATGQLGEVYDAQGLDKQALYQFLEARRLVTEINGLVNIAYCNERLGDFMVMRQKPDAAITYYTDALVIWEQMNDRLGQASCWARLSEAYLQIGQTEVAIGYGEKALLVANHERYMRIRQMATQALYRAYQTDGQPTRALAMFENYVTLKDSLADQKRLEEVVAIQKKYDIEKVLTEAEKRRLIQQQQLTDMRRETDVARLRADAERDLLAAETRELQLRQRIEAERLRTDAAQKQLSQRNHIASLNQNIQEQLTTRALLLGGLLVLLLLLGSMYRTMRVVMRQRAEIETLNVGLEDKVRARTAELEAANTQLRAKNRDIEDALLRGQTQERKRVAADLHDNLGGLISAIKMSLTALNPSHLSDREQQVYDNLLNMTKEAYAEVRYLSHNMQPDELEKQGLVQALRRLVQKLNDTQSVAFSIKTEKLVPLGKTAEFHLYSICLELCNNILKHAGATEAYIEFRCLGQSSDRDDEPCHELAMIVRDNGRGMETVPTSETIAESGMGLRNIQARTEAMHGQLEVYSELGEGTTFFFTLPVSPTFA